jgi:hypothetical protein
MESLPNLWMLREDIKISWDFDKILLKNPRVGIENSHEIKVAAAHLRDATKSDVSAHVNFPYWFPILRLNMPNSGFSADYFFLDGFEFCSRRFRDALAQPEHAVQFVPVELISGGPEIVAQDYQLFRVMAHQPALDLDRSDCEIEEFTTRRTREQIKILRNVKQYALRDDLHPQTEIFRADENPSIILVADAVAERVLRAGCTGMEFAHPNNPQGRTGIVRYRTINGIAERRLDAPVLPKRKPRERKITQALKS